MNLPRIGALRFFSGNSLFEERQGRAERRVVAREKKPKRPARPGSPIFLMAEKPTAKSMASSTVCAAAAEKERCSTNCFGIHFLHCPS